MNYGVVLPIWQLTIAEAESLTMKPKSWDSTASSSPITSWPSRPPRNITAATGPTRSRCSPFSPDARGGSSSAPASSCCLIVRAGGGQGRGHRRSGLGRTLIFGVGVGWDEAEFADLRLPFRERGRLSDDYIRAIKAAWAADVPEYKGHYVSFSGATFSPRPKQQPHPPIWVGGAPGSISSPAVRRCAELGDAWHPLALGLDEIEKGFATLRDLAARAGRRDTIGLAPRNALDLTDAAKGGGRAAFQGSVAEVPPTSVA